MISGFSMIRVKLIYYLGFNINSADHNQHSTWDQARGD